MAEKEKWDNKLLNRKKDEYKSNFYYSLIDAFVREKDIKASLYFDKYKEFLKLDNNDVALVMHPGNVVEVVLTKMTDKNKAITPEEDLAMSLALFLKQKEFCELLTHTFHDLAMRNVGPYNDKLEEK